MSQVSHRNTIALRKFFEELSKRRRLKFKLDRKSVSPEISLIRLLLSDNQTITRRGNLHTRFGVYSVPYWVNNESNKPQPSEHIADIPMKGGPQVLPSKTDEINKTSPLEELNNEIKPLVNTAGVSNVRKQITYNQLLEPTSLKFLRNYKNIKNPRKLKVPNKIIQKNKLKDNRVQQDNPTYQSNKGVEVYCSKVELVPKVNLPIKNISKKESFKEIDISPSPTKHSTPPKHDLPTDQAEAKPKTKQILQDPIVMDNAAPDAPFSHSIRSIIRKRYRKKPEEHSLLKCRTSVHKHSQSSINKDNLSLDISLFKKTVANLKRRKKGLFGRSSIKSLYKGKMSDWSASSDAETDHSMDSYTRFCEKKNKRHKKRRHSKYSMISTDDSLSHSSRDSFAIFAANYDREFKNLTHQPHRPSQVSFEVRESTQKSQKDSDASSSLSSLSSDDSLKKDIKIDDPDYFQRDAYKLSFIAPINQEDFIRSSQQRESHDNANSLVQKVIKQRDSVTVDPIVHRAPSIETSMSIFDDTPSCTPDGEWERTNVTERRRYYESRVAEIMTRVEIREDIPVKKPPRNFLKEALTQKWETRRSQTPIKQKIKDKYPTKLVKCTKHQAEGVKPFKVRRYIYQDNTSKKSPKKIEKIDACNILCQPCLIKKEKGPPSNSNMKKKSNNLEIKSYNNDSFKPGQQKDFRVLDTTCNCKRLPRSKWPAS